MEVLYRYANAVAVSLLSFFAPACPLIVCALAFICADFLSGVLADRRLTLRSGRRWYFASAAAWRTVRKAGFVIISIAMAWLVERCVLDFVELHLAKMLAGFVCAVEMWSFLENASVLADTPLFVQLRGYVRRRIGDTLGDDTIEH